MSHVSGGGYASSPSDPKVLLDNNDEMLVVSIADSLDGLKLPEIQRKWHAKIGIEYIETRQFLSITDELGT